MFSVTHRHITKLILQNTILILGQTFTISQTINVALDLPFGINQAYLNTVQPTAMLRTWASTQLATPLATHNLDIKIEFGSSADSFDATKEKTFTATFSSAVPINSDDYEFPFMIPDFHDFDFVQ